MLKPAPTPGDTGWFVHDRFGMFIHWGLYALPARHEWVKSRELIADEPYQQYFDHFDPDLGVWTFEERNRQEGQSVHKTYEKTHELLIVPLTEALVQLCEQFASADVATAIRDLGLDPERIDPRYA